ncbi:unnamed protein product [Heterobilharzia americana]|nr:unnamed protein product [Heterobilharzia americana]
MDFETIASQIIHRRKSSKLRPWQKLKSKVIISGFEKVRSKYDSVMSGKFSDLPRMNSKSIRVFISSTFSGKFYYLIRNFLFQSAKDLNLERNVLMKHVYPKLKAYCREKYGFDFYVSLNSG